MVQLHRGGGRMKAEAGKVTLIREVVALPRPVSQRFLLCGGMAYPATHRKEKTYAHHTAGNLL